jgi:hypothetical protein
VGAVSEWLMLIEQLMQSEYDFSFYRHPLQIRKENADCWPTLGNELDVIARKPDFKIEVSGFDPNRDLIIEAQS